MLIVWAIMPGQIAGAFAEQEAWKLTGNPLVLDYFLREQKQLARRGNGMKEAIDLVCKTAGP